MMKSLGFVLFVLLIWGCATLVEKPVSVEWHTVYRPIDDVEAVGFLNNGVELLVRKHGEPNIPINEVLLRYTLKNDDAAHYRVATRFSKLELVDRERGVFCIYLAVPPSHKRFYYLLGHEIGHLLRPEIIESAEEERFCNEFSRQLCAQENRPWRARWETRKWVRRE